MTSGLGISIGTVNVVSARVGAPDARPVVRTRRTAVGFDSGGTARLGGITRFSTAVNEFADLGRNPESVYVDGRIWSPATIFASVVQGLVAAEPATGVVATHPAGYSAEQLELLRQSLDLAGVGHVQLVPEPVAAAHWLDTEHGPLDSGFVLVYDLGGNSLDVAVVRTGPDWPDHPVVGKPVRSYEFGARPLGALIARCAGDRAIGPAEPDTGVVSLVSFVNPEGLRREHVRDSLEVVRTAVRSAGVALSDIGRVLVVGGAARPPQIAETLTELGLPVTVAADSGQCVALGAAAMAAESVAPAASSRMKHPPIFSGAALFSAVAMSAATILGTGPADTELPEDRTPIQGPGAVLYEIHGEAQVERSGSGWTVSYAPLGDPARIAPAAATRPYGPPMPGPASVPAAPGTDRPAVDGTGTHHAPLGERPDSGPRHTDPARFAHPIPFGHVGGLPAGAGTDPEEPGHPGPDAPGGDPGPDHPPVGEGPGGTAPGGERDPGHHPGGWSPGAGLPDSGLPGAGPDQGNGSGGWTTPGNGPAGPGSGSANPGGHGGDAGGFGSANPGGFGGGVDGVDAGGSGADGGGSDGTDAGSGGGDSQGPGSGGGHDSDGAAAGRPGRSDSSFPGGFGGGPASRGGAGQGSDSGGPSRGSDSAGGSHSRGPDSGGSRSGGGDNGSSRGGNSRAGSRGGSHH
ncbi:Hsp70 family protein [Nocardia sp. NBC_00416]|uniref:Hsp70 family protein n=1 Tax=Nocardia sp. NBC_00416 TaxID=2975991 RepID=UPI002E1DC552